MYKYVFKRLKNINENYWILFLDKIFNVYGKIVLLFEIYKIWLIIGNIIVIWIIKIKNIYKIKKV